MTKYNITLIPGDGTGPEIVEATRRVLEATGVKFDWDIQEAGIDVLEKYGTPLPDKVIESIKRNKIALKGPITTPVGKGFRSVNVALRKTLGLFACLRPCKSYKGVRSRYEDVDLVIVRENMEDLYAGVEFQKGSDGARKLIQLAADTGAGFLLLEDLGDRTFTRALSAGDDEAALYSLATDTLAALHTRWWADHTLEPPPVYGEEELLRETRLLIEWYWPEVFGTACPEDVSRAFEDAWRVVLPAATRTLLPVLVLRLVLLLALEPRLLLVLVARSPE